jgi:uncharacterized membrane protein YhaH (DUF805 family)
MNFPTAIKSCLSNYAGFSGRARRSEFWYFTLFSILANLIASILDGALFGLPGGPIGGILSLGLFLPSLAVAARRLHDTGRSGWWMLLGLIPLIGWVVLLIWYVGRGEDGPNRFGADPRAPGDWTPAGAAALNRPWQRP